MMRRADAGAGDAEGTTLAPPFNSVVLIDRHGEVVYTYDKVHTCTVITNCNIALLFCQNNLDLRGVF